MKYPGNCELRLAFGVRPLVGAFCYVPVIAIGESADKSAHSKGRPPVELKFFGSRSLEAAIDAALPVPVLRDNAVPGIK